MPTEIHREQVRRMFEARAALVEVLPAKEYEERHIFGAIHIPLAKLEREAAERLDPASDVIVYCYDYQ